MLGHNKSKKSFFGDERRIETFAVITFSIYLITMIVFILSRNMPNWIEYIMMALFFVLWMIYISRRFSYKTRSYLYTVILMTGMFFYSIYTVSFISTLIAFLGACVVVGLFRIPNLMFVTLAYFIAIFIYRYFILNIFSVETPEKFFEVGTPVFNTLIIIFVIWFWIKKSNEYIDENASIIEELKIAEKSRDDFMANISHEIRTPINTISVMTDLVSTESDPIKRKDELASIQIASRNLLTVVTDVLDFSELQTGKISILESNYSILGIIEDCLLVASAWKAGKDVELIVNIDTDIPRVLIGDPEKIKRVIQNILNNAIKFTKEGCVVLDVSCREEYYGVNLVISVRDTGIGMNDETLDKLFTSFNQADTSRSRSEGGIGLGLAICQFLIGEMGGSLSVFSKENSGSEFRIVIPQKIEDEDPVIKLKSADDINAIVFDLPSKYKYSEVRDEYYASIRNIIRQLSIRGCMIDNLNEVKRRISTGEYTHLFITPVEYALDESYFNEIAKTITVVASCDEFEEVKIHSKHILRIYKPFFVGPLARAIDNGFDTDNNGVATGRKDFVAPEGKVLVVDDSLMNLKVASSILEKYEVQSVLATSGIEALNLVESCDYDFIFMDHMMPEMDGVETAKRIRNKHGRYYSEVPIIALTANDVPGAREMFMENGFQGFLSKPIEKSSLEKILYEIIPESKLIPVSERHNDSIEDNLTNEVVEYDIHIEGVDVPLGLSYCGDIEDYIDILNLNVKEADTTVTNIRDSYNDENWDNYSVYVHGLKSAFKMIGAMEVSDMAKRLERAGKEKDISLIRSDTDELISAFTKQIDAIRAGLEAYLGESVSDAEDISDDADLLPEISAEEIETFLNTFDSAVYTFDSGKIRKALSAIEGKSYDGKNLDSLIKQVESKIDMSDFMSANDMLHRHFDA